MTVDRNTNAIFSAYRISTRISAKQAAAAVEMTSREAPTILKRRIGYSRRAKVNSALPEAMATYCFPPTR